MKKKKLLKRLARLAPEEPAEKHDEPEPSIDLPGDLVNLSGAMMNLAECGEKELYEKVANLAKEKLGMKPALRVVPKAPEKP